MADIITTSENIGINDPKIKAIAKRVLGACILSAQKATMHAVNARSFPMPADRGAMESLLHDRFVSLDSSKRAGAVARVRDHLAAGPAVRAALVGPELAALDLQDSRSMFEHVKAIPMAPTMRLSRDLLAAPRALHGPSGLIPLQPSKRLGLRIHKVRCVDETNPEWGGDDEIALGGTTVDETGDVTKVAEFGVRNDFDDGEQKVYSPPKEFVWFNLSEGTAWPKSYFVTLVLAEKDMGGLSDFLNKMLDKVKTEVITALSTAVGAAIGTSGGPIGTIIGSVVGWIVGQVFAWLKAWWSDDVFAPQTVSISLPSANATFSGGAKDSLERTLTYQGFGGTYAVTFDWILSPIAGGT
ncbi:MAG: hypothetical protein IPI49_14955 [Myxococcales bacterium]|nr:hypothetical protein [Myxococcales bacterium]HRC55067.1 hypothetical protein [Kofleriaceae bacterium]